MAFRSSITSRPHGRCARPSPPCRAGWRSVVYFPRRYRPRGPFGRHAGSPRPKSSDRVCHCAPSLARPCGPGQARPSLPRRPRLDSPGARATPAGNRWSLAEAQRARGASKPPRTNGGPEGPRPPQPQPGGGYPPPGASPAVPQGIRGGRKKAKKWPFLDPCGAKSRGSGGAPPTHLILLRNQRSVARARRATLRRPGPGGAGGRGAPLGGWVWGRVGSRGVFGCLVGDSTESSPDGPKAGCPAGAFGSPPVPARVGRNLRRRHPDAVAPRVGLLSRQDAASQGVSAPCSSLSLLRRVAARAWRPMPNETAPPTGTPGPPGPSVRPCGPQSGALWSPGVPDLPVAPSPRHLRV